MQSEQLGEKSRGGKARKWEACPWPGAQGHPQSRELSGGRALARAAASPDSRGSSLHPETGRVSVPAQVRAAGQACEGARLLSNRSAPEPVAHTGASLREVVEPPSAHLERDGLPRCQCGWGAGVSERQTPDTRRGCECRRDWLNGVTAELRLVIVQFHYKLVTTDHALLILMFYSVIFIFSDSRSNPTSLIFNMRKLRLKGT